MENKYVIAYGEKVGLSHGDVTPCQDKALAMIKNGVTVAVLSDGCGSSTISHEGSRITVEVVSNFLADHFDELIKKGFDPERKNNATLETRKAFVENIINAHFDFIRKNKELMLEQSYKDEKATDFKSEIEFLKLLNATIIFYAEKDDVGIIGQIGDGNLGMVVRNVMKIILEEMKEGEVNETCYPSVLYELANTREEKDRWYLSNYFRMFKIPANNVSGALLTSDGAGTFISRAVAHQRSYTGVKKLYAQILEAKDEDEKNDVIESTLFKLQQKAPMFDDVSFVSLCTKDVNIESYEIKTSEKVIEKKQEEHINRKDNPDVNTEEIEKRKKKLPVIKLDETDLSYLEEARKVFNDVDEDVFKSLKGAALSLDEYYRNYSFLKKMYPDGFDRVDLYNLYIYLLDYIKENSARSDDEKEDISSFEQREAVKALFDKHINMFKSKSYVAIIESDKKISLIKGKYYIR